MLAFAVAGSRSRDTGPGAPAGPEGLPPGASAPEFELPDLSGEVHSLDSLRASGHPVLLVFSDPNCGPCTELAPKIARWQREHAGDLTVAVIEREPNGDDPASADRHGRRMVLLQRESEIADLYRAQGTPTAVLLGEDGAIASPVAAGGSQIEALLGQALGGNEWRAPTPSTRALFGFPLRRRELLVRAAGAWAATTAVLAWPLQVVAAIDPRRRAEPCQDNFDCPDPHNMRCRGGRCQCDEDLTRCDPREATTRRCFNLQRSRDHCGRCNHACRGDFPECCEGQCGEFGQTRCNCAGTCCDYNGQTCCPGGCKNTSLDDSNCGACGNVCKPGEYCRFGVCTCPLGMTCG
jgi:thiol-disulfide isomerase/thioredoxin